MSTVPALTVWIVMCEEREVFTENNGIEIYRLTRFPVAAFFSQDEAETWGVDQGIIFAITPVQLHIDADNYTLATLLKVAA